MDRETADYKISIKDLPCRALITIEADLEPAILLQFSEEMKRDRLFSDCFFVISSTKEKVKIDVDPLCK